MDDLTKELASSHQNSAYKEELRAAQQAKRDAEARVQELEAERESIASEIEDMQKALTRLQTEAASETQARVFHK